MSCTTLADQVAHENQNYNAMKPQANRADALSD